MSTQAIQNVSLNPYLTECAADKARSLNCKAFMYNTLTKVCAVALVAIVTTVLYISYTGMVLSGTASLLLTATVLSTLFFGWGLSRFKIWANGYEKRAAISTAVDEELKKIADWKTAQVEAFLQEQGLDINLIPQNDLRQLNSDEPLCALLPMIAIYNFLKSSAEKIEAASQAQMNPKIEESAPDHIKRQQRYHARMMAYSSHEQEVLPRMLQAAVILQLIQNPTLKLGLKDLGKFRAKDYAERLLDREYEPINDHYFVFHPNLNRAPLTLTEVEGNFNPVQLRRLLFPYA